MNKRIDFIDYTRGFAAVLVLLSHALEIFIEGWAYTFQWFNLGQVGVIAFFMVSGYIIPYSMDKANNIGEFIKGRISRIYPLYIFVAFITGIIFLTGYFQVAEHLQNQNISILILSHLFFVQDMIYGETGMTNLVPGNWTLLIEWIWYGFFVFLFAFGFHKKMKLVILLYHALLLALAGVSFFAGFRLPYGRLCMVSICLTGYLFYLHHKKEISFSLLCNLLIVSLTVLALALYITFGYYKNETFTLMCVTVSWLTGILMFVFFTTVTISNSLLSGSLSYLGKISYSVYLVHPNVLYVFRNYKDSYHPVLLLVLCFTVSVLISALTYNFVEKPSIKFLRQKFSSKRTESAS